MVTFLYHCLYVLLTTQLSGSTLRDRQTTFRHILTGNTELVEFLVPLIK